MALFHFNQIVSKQPTNWDALTRLIEVSMRLGQIQECEQYINKAEEDCFNPAKEPGEWYQSVFVSAGRGQHFQDFCTAKLTISGILVI